MTTTIAERAAVLQADLDRIVDLIESEHYAKAFDNLGQYRASLLEFIIAVEGGAPVMQKAEDAVADVICWLPVTQHLPDADRTVMIYAPEASEPVWLGYYDGEQWVAVDGMPVIPTHWCEMPKGPSI